MTASLTAAAAPTDKISAYIAAATKAAWGVEGLPAGTPVKPIKKVGVLGAGTMGGGISMNFANVGIEVTIVEVQQAALERGLGVIRKNYQNSADKGRFPQEEVGIRMGLLKGTLNRADLADCDLIIEAIFEDMAIKKEIFADLDKIAKPGCILASKRPQDVIGLHFFSPANVMKLLEIVRAKHTSDTVVATSMDLAKKIGKVAALAGVCPGFIGNRMLARRQQAAAYLVQAGAMPWDIDAAFNKFGFKMGPFQMSDLAGLDIGWKPGAKTANPLRDMICERTPRRGQKSGAGYYDYDAARNGTPSPEVEAIVKEYQAASGVAARKVTHEEILEECVFSMINEGAAILEEGMAQRAGDIDVTWLNGYGFPQDKGGPMFLGDKVGLQRVLEVTERVSKVVPEVKVSNLLRAMAKDGRKFADLPAQPIKV
ncbi:MAG: 3-hydroxyacyl-CoA dehydrogenase [Alphaproteobacteria bacterium]|nr:MAG: 3-hydroxyacyl-CoA dehydrogenase [Alphaproteobacteria bacterium]